MWDKNAHIWVDIMIFHKEQYNTWYFIFIPIVSGKGNAQKYQSNTHRSCVLCLGAGLQDA